MERISHFNYELYIFIQICKFSERTNERGGLIS